MFSSFSEYWERRANRGGPHPNTCWPGEWTLGHNRYNVLLFRWRNLPGRKKNGDDVISGYVWLKSAQAHKLYREESFCHLLKDWKGALDQIHYDFYMFLGAHYITPFLNFVQPEQSVLVHGKISPPSDLRHEHAAPVAMPHLPITATTKVAEIRSPGSPGSPSGSPPSLVSEESTLSQSAPGTKHIHQSTGEPVQAGDGAVACIV